MSARLFRCSEHIIPAQHIRGYFRATADPEEERLHLAVKQYTPIDNAHPEHGDVTIIACHAAGFFKEMYEPLFDEILRKFQQSDSTIRLRGIWIADVASHGASGVLNEGHLGNDYCWDDHARDLLFLTSFFRGQMPMPLVGLGHSMGAVNIIQLALIHPRLFTAVICIEPPIYKQFDRFNYTEAFSIMKRRDVWASRQDAINDIRKGGLQRSWDRRVLDNWERYAFRELPTLLYPEAPAEIAMAAARQGSSPVTFSTTKHHTTRAYCRGAHPPPGQPLEAFVPTLASHPDISKEEHSIQQSPLYRPEVNSVFWQLPTLRPPCIFVYGAYSTFFSASSQSQWDKLSITGTAVGGSGGLQANAVKNVVLNGAGHFVPFEKPDRVAEVTFEWLSTQLEKWKVQQVAYAQAWAKICLRKKAMVEDDTRWWAQEWYSAKAEKGREVVVAVLDRKDKSKL